MIGVTDENVPALIEATDQDEDVPDLLEHDTSNGSAQGPDLTARRVPLTIICGFLGAGKSTLVKRILTERHGYRIAVIMNEFADTADIEAKTINVSSPNDPTGQQSEEFLELANGCLCCSIKDSGIAAIEKLMQKKGAFDYILLETTGLADPGPIASMFWQNEEFSQGLGSDICLDGVVCVVDAVFGRQQMEEDRAVDGVGESLRQIACADVVLLNKCDLVSPAELKAMEELLHKVNPAVTIHRTIRAEVDLGNVVGIAAYALRAPVSTAKIAATGEQAVGHEHGEGCDHDHDHDHGHQGSMRHYEVRGISSVQVTCPPLSPERLEKLDEWIRTVLWENRVPAHFEYQDVTGIEVLRCKGLFCTTTGEKYVLQGVKSLYEMTKVELGGEDEVGVPEEGKLVLIGKGLGAEGVRGSLEKVLRGH